MSKITVKAKSERGFWRAGIHFTRDGVELDTTKLKKAALEAIRDEPNLVVTEQGESAAEKKAREKAEAEAANAAAIEREEAAKAHDAAAWQAATDAAVAKGKFDQRAWGKLPASERVALIEAEIQPAA